MVRSASCGDVDEASSPAEPRVQEAAAVGAAEVEVHAAPAGSSTSTSGGWRTTAAAATSLVARAVGSAPTRALPRLPNRSCRQPDNQGAGEEAIEMDDRGRSVTEDAVLDEGEYEAFL